VNIEAGKRLARGLMKEHGLKGWVVQWAWWWDHAARCMRPMKWILLSVPYVEANEEKEVREVVLHEIAHALTAGAGDQAHDEEWRRVFVAIGGSGRVNPLLRVPVDPRGGTERPAMMGLVKGKVDG
jgi:hypothetical protein